MKETTRKQKTVKSAIREIRRMNLKMAVICQRTDKGISLIVHVSLQSAAQSMKFKRRKKDHI